LPFAEGIKCFALLLFLAFFRVFRGQKSPLPPFRKGG
jgi:hypothetical protein